MEHYASSIFYLKKKVIFPYCTMKVEINTSDHSRKLEKGDKITAFPVRSFLDMLFYRKKTATVAEIVEVEVKENKTHLELKGLTRVSLVKISRFRQAEFTLIEEEPVDSTLPLWDELRKKAQELIFLINVEESDKLISLLAYIINMHQLTDFVANYFVMDFPRRYTLYRELNAEKRGNSLTAILDKLIEKMNTRRSEEET